MTTNSKTIYHSGKIDQQEFKTIDWIIDYEDSVLLQHVLDIEGNILNGYSLPFTTCRKESDAIILGGQWKEVPFSIYLMVDRNTVTWYEKDEHQDPSCYEKYN